MFVNCTLRLSSRIVYNRSNNCLRKYYGNNGNSNTQTIINFGNQTNCGNSNTNVVIYFEDKRQLSTWPPRSRSGRSMSGPLASAAVSASDEKHHSSKTMASNHTNRLADEKSPYLLQHAHNPVDWYPWGSEAIEKARRENKVIFLSVGYSTCHWCHVMEKESFENPDVAALMNRHYVNIKVDREERPDIDKIYMQFLLMLNNSGGWPMSVWLTPDLTPITAGTYFPPTDRYGVPGFVTVLEKIAELWCLKGNELTVSGLKIVDLLEKSSNDATNIETGTAYATDIIEHRLDEAIRIYKQNSDDLWGGFGTAPKFPEVSKLNLAFHLQTYRPDSEMVEVALKTLNHIADGGIHDHVFGGFCRYSVDRQWHIPHFEKMLYDQGQLLTAYSIAYKMTRDELHLDVCDRIFQYLQTDLRHPNGGYFSGEDADSSRKYGDIEKVEGAFYAWTQDEIKDAFAKAQDQFSSELTPSLPIEVYCYYYGIDATGNVPLSKDPHGHLVGRNILHVQSNVSSVAKKFNMTEHLVKSIIKTGNHVLYEERNKRPRPQLDTKIVTAWNGLVLSGLSSLANISNAPKRQAYLQAARELVDFLQNNSFNKQTMTLIRSCYGEGVGNEEIYVPEQPVDGFLDDYAFLIKGLIDYYVATLDIDALRWAKQLQDTQDLLFWDEHNGGYFYSQANAKHVIVRLKENHDGAEPCGNSVSARNLMLISAYFADKSYKSKSEKLLDFFSTATPFAFVLPEMFSAQLMKAANLAMMVVVGPKNEATEKLFDVARDFYIPNILLIHFNPDESVESLTRPAVAKFKMIRNEPTVYLCHNRVCQLPITSPDEFRKTLAEKYFPVKLNEIE